MNIYNKIMCENVAALDLSINYDCLYIVGVCGIEFHISVWFAKEYQKGPGNRFGTEFEKFGGTVRNQRLVWLVRMSNDANQRN